MTIPNFATPGWQRARVRRRFARTAACAAACVLSLFMAFALAVPLAAAQPPSAASQDGFVPVNRAAQPEAVPASRLVLAAYGFAWVMLFGYLWSIWTRIGRVERELHVVKRRVDSGERRT